MNRFTVSNCVNLTNCRVYLNSCYKPFDMDIDLLEKVFYYHIEKTLDKDQCRSRCLEMVEGFAYDLENQKADRLLEIGVMIEAVISNDEATKIKAWADTL